MSAADGDFLALRSVGNTDLDPDADGISIGARLFDLQGHPVARRSEAPGRAEPGVAPDLGRGRTIDDDEVKEAVQVEIGKRAAPAFRGAVDTRFARRFPEGAVRLAEQQVVGVALGEILHGLDVALGDKEINETVVVDVIELGVPTGRRQYVIARMGAMSGDSRFVC